MSRRPLALAAAVAALVLAVALSRNPAQPYVVTAINYHFHDAHPTFPIAPGRDLVVKNASSNVHNVTIPALNFSEDVQPGGQIVIPDIASQFRAPGRYTFVCLYHQDRGMSGTLIIAGG